ncbi:hypothetical protein LUZ60_004016 [Juncus effusus]|nr:hypothetical protein LUZ60_004016 [Juncus effusus]
MEAIMMSSTEGALRVLMGKLGDVLAQKVVMMKGVRKGIQFVKDELEGMNAFLQNYATMEEKDVQVRTWMKQVREMAYDAEDCIDKFVHDLETPNGKGFIRFLSKITRLLTTLKARYTLANQIKNLKTRSDEISTRQTKFGILINPESSSRYGSTSSLIQIDPRLPALFAEETKLVGIEAPRAELVIWLEDLNNPNLSVLSIVGFGGLGKTTLAMMVYRSLSVRGDPHFQCGAFVTISQVLDSRLIFKDILKQLVEFIQEGSPAVPGATQIARQDPSENLETLGVGQLATKIRQHLQGKRYLVVLDDLWSPLAWEGMKFVFPDNNNGSRIIVTTRIENVAYNCCSRDHDNVYKMQPLPDALSMELFLKRVFGRVQSCPPELHEPSADILKKCHGIPLAIVSIGGLFASKPNKTKEEWQKVHDSLGSEIDNNPTLEGMKKILNYSYNDLPYHLKACFLYLSIFPEDHKIKRSSLIRRWVAEGFVSGRRGLSMEDVADSYFHEFISRGILQSVDIGVGGKVKTCRVHDVMLDVIVSKSTDENFVTLLSDQFIGIPHNKIRRLSIHTSNNTTSALVRKDLGHVRSLITFTNVEQLLASHTFTLLRILDLEGSTGLTKPVMKNICKLFQLKYLSIRRTDALELPNKIRDLQYLETMDIRGTPITKLPTEISKLQNLRHLHASSFKCYYNGAFKLFLFDTLVEMPDGLENLKSLQTIAHINFTENNHVLEAIGQLTQLRKLGIATTDPDPMWAEMPLLLSLEKLSNSLRCLSILEGHATSLVTIWDELRSPPLRLQTLEIFAYLTSLPPWFSLLSNLTRITFCFTALKQDSTPILSNLPNLLCLRLYVGSYHDGLFYVDRNGFPKLKLLVFEFTLLATMEFKDGALPKLERLVWVFKDEGVLQGSGGILGIEHLSNLKEVGLGGNINDNTRSFVDIITACVQKNPKNPKISVADIQGLLFFKIPSVIK